MAQTSIGRSAQPCGSGAASKRKAPANEAVQTRSSAGRGCAGLGLSRRRSRVRVPSLPSRLAGLPRSLIRGAASLARLTPLDSRCDGLQAPVGPRRRLVRRGRIEMRWPQRFNTSVVTWPGLVRVPRASASWRGFAPAGIASEGNLCADRGTPAARGRRAPGLHAAHAVTARTAHKAHRRFPDSSVRCRAVPARLRAGARSAPERGRSAGHASGSRARAGPTWAQHVRRCNHIVERGQRGAASSPTSSACMNGHVNGSAAPSRRFARNAALLSRPREAAAYEAGAGSGDRRRGDGNAPAPQGRGRAPVGCAR